MATICRHHVLTCMNGLGDDLEQRLHLLTRAGINPELLDRQEQRFHADQVARLFRLVIDTLNDEFMGFTSRDCKAGIFATMCELTSRCSSIGELLRRAAKFYALITEDMQMRLHQHGDIARLEIVLAHPELDADNFLAEFLLVIWHRFPSWYGAAPITLVRTGFTFARPEHFGELQIMFPGQLCFEQQCNFLEFHASVLKRPLTRTQYELAEFVATNPSQLMAIAIYENTIEGQVERLLNKHGKFINLSLEDAASELAITAQQLHRRLARAETTFQRIKDNQRRELAIKLLSLEGISVETIADQLGFTEARSFTRAFKQWTGLSPRSFRQINRS